MNLSFLVTFYLSMISVATATAPVRLFARSLSSGKTLDLGLLTYNHTVGKAEIVDFPEILLDSAEEADQQYCIGAEINGNSQCHALQVLSKPWNYELTLTTKPKTGELISISFRKTNANGITANIKPALIGAKPSLRDIKIQKDAVTGEVKEEVPQTFIQKYWMYIVPVVILLATSGGGNQ